MLLLLRGHHQYPFTFSQKPKNFKKLGSGVFHEQIRVLEIIQPFAVNIFLKMHLFLKPKPQEEIQFANDFYHLQFLAFSPIYQNIYQKLRPAFARQHVPPVKHVAKRKSIKLKLKLKIFLTKM